MIGVKDVIEQKQKTLRELEDESAKVLDVVNSTINKLSTINEKIDATIDEITEQKAKLQSTEVELNKTKVHNAKIIDKFRSLIED